MSARSIATALTWLAVALALAAGAASLSFAHWDPDALARLGEGVVREGLASRFPADRVAGIQARMALVGGAGLLVGLALWLVRRPFAEGTASALSALPGAWRGGAERVARFVREEPLHAGCLAALALGYLALALSVLGQPIRCDEAGTSLHHVSKPWLSVLSIYRTNNHVLYSLLAKGSCGLLDDPSLCLRVPALLAGALLVPATYLALRIQLGRSVALLGAALFASSVYAVDFATNGRGYSLLALAFLALLAVAPRLLRGGGPLWWSAFVAISAIGFFTVPVMAYPFAVVSVWVLLSVALVAPPEGRSVFLRRFGVALAATAVLVAIAYTPTFAVTGFGSVVSNPTIERNRVDSQPVLLLEFAHLMKLVWKDWSFGQPSLVPPLLLAGLGFGALRRRRRNPDFDRLLLSALVGVTAVVVVTRALPPSWIFLFLLPVYLGLASAGLLALASAVVGTRGRARAERLLMPAAAALFAACLWAQLSSDAASRVRWYVGYREAPEAARYLAHVLEPGDSIEAHHVALPPVAFYLRERGVADPLGWIGLAPRATGAVYFVEARKREASRGERERLRELGFSEERVVHTLDRSRILRLARPEAPPLEQ